MIHEGLGHWMQKKDAVALPWMTKFTRNPYPTKIVWKQDDVTHNRYYWIALPSDQVQPRSLLRADIQGQEIHVTSEDISAFSVLLHDELVDLNQSVTVLLNGQIRFKGKVTRTLAALAKSFSERPDPKCLFPARIDIKPES